MAFPESLEDPGRVSLAQSLAQSPFFPSLATQGPTLTLGGLIAQATGGGDESVSAGAVVGGDAAFRASTDLGDFLQKSLSQMPSQSRNPIVTEILPNGESNRQVLGSGSHWIPARMDLDTMLSKIDSRIVQEVAVIKGPYSALYGPAFSFIDFEFLPAPRHSGAFQTSGRTSFDFKSNGEQWYGRQAIWGGGEQGGYRVGYGHRTGNDYRAGNGELIPSSYNSRELDVAWGWDFTPDRHMEFHYLRLDQTGVELAGQVFDIDFLATDGFEVEYVMEDFAFGQIEVEAWYNRTRLAGNADGKGEQFPFFQRLNLSGATDVDSMSTGYRLLLSQQTDQLTVKGGSDLRFVKQELNEITSADGFGLISAWDSRNSPIPRSHWSNPGLFTHGEFHFGDIASLSLGGRVDWVSANIEEDSTAPVSTRGGGTGIPYNVIVGERVPSRDFDRDFDLWSAFVTLDRDLSRCMKILAGYGYAERAPTLTELYAAEPFMFVLQNGLNVVTGDPLLKKERLHQCDLGFGYDNGTTRFRINGFYAWIGDYITFEAVEAIGVGVIDEQLNLKFVNTELATLSGGDLFVELDLNAWMTTFATASYVEGRDHRRNGTFATAPAFSAGDPSRRVSGLPRGPVAGLDFETTRRYCRTCRHFKARSVSAGIQRSPGRTGAWNYPRA